MLNVRSVLNVCACGCVCLCPMGRIVSEGVWGWEAGSDWMSRSHAQREPMTEWHQRWIGLRREKHALFPMNGMREPHAVV